jgi:hypothetical protein
MSDRSDELQKRRAERREAAQAAHDAQKDVDLEHVDALEEVLGAAQVKVIETDPLPGVAALVAIRCPSPSEIKRYRDRIRDGKNQGKDTQIAALQELGKACWAYPEIGSELGKATLEKFPGLDTQAGGVAVGLSIGREERLGKD